MRKIALCLFCAALLLANCFKDKNDCVPRDLVAPSSEQLTLTDYITSRGINATRHTSGLYYQIIQEGTGNNPSICSSIKVGFNGKLVNGAEVERDDNTVLNLKLMLEGWRITLPLIKAGGKIRIWLPPTLAYGWEGKKVGNTEVVPPNSILIYDISLYEVL
ncbi:MAG: FKBP-type peptidyl-prolyl cis-trans isomerase [Niastella sp.]|nr:FKBP-type peptidyl-prolyl cis-trans isomerase [Niastella sp.]